MPCPHHDIKIVQRSNRQSAVAAAAYQSGERLFSEYDQKQKYYAEKRASPFCAGSPLRTPAYVLPDQSQSSTTSRAEAGLTVLRSIRSTSASMREMLTVMLGITAISPPCSATFTP